MKPTNVKSRILKRLIPVLLVPVVLSSNFAAVYASADDETAGIEAQVTETTQDNSQEETTEEVVEEVIEETVEEAASEEQSEEGTEEVVPVTDEEISTTGDTLEEETEESDEELDEEETEEETEEEAPEEETEEETEELEDEELEEDEDELDENGQKKNKKGGSKKGGSKQSETELLCETLSIDLTVVGVQDADILSAHIETDNESADLTVGSNEIPVYLAQEETVDSSEDTDSDAEDDADSVDVEDTDSDDEDETVTGDESSDDAEAETESESEDDADEASESEDDADEASETEDDADEQIDSQDETQESTDGADDSATVTFELNKDGYEIDKVELNGEVVDSDAFTFSILSTSLHSEIRATLHATDTELPVLGTPQWPDSGLYKNNAYYSKNKGALAVKVTAKDEKLDAEGNNTESGIDKVYAVCKISEEPVQIKNCDFKHIQNSDEYVLEPDDVLGRNQRGFYEILEIVALDNAGKSKSFTPDPGIAICYYSEDSSIGIDQGHNNDRWYTTAVSVNVSDYSYRPIDQIYLYAADKETVLETIDVTNHWFGLFYINEKVNFPDVEGKNDYYLKVKYIDGEFCDVINTGSNPRTNKFVVRIDKKAPGASCTEEPLTIKATAVPQTRDSENFWQWIQRKVNEIVKRLLFSQVPVKVTFTIPKTADDTEELKIADEQVSGVKTLTYRLANSDKDIPVDVVPQGDHYEASSMVDIKQGENSELVFEISSIDLYDAAGNHEGSLKLDADFKVIVIDRGAPKLDFEYNEEVLAVNEPEVGEVLYFNTPVAGKIVANDFDLGVSMQDAQDSVDDDDDETLVPNKPTVTDLTSEKVDQSHLLPYENRSADGRDIRAYSFSAGYENSCENEYKIEASIQDAARNTSKAESVLMRVDTKAPEVTMKLNGKDYSECNGLYFSDAVRVDVSVDERWPDDSASYLVITGEVDGINNTDSSVFRSEDDPYKLTGEFGESAHSFDVPVLADGTYEIKVYVKDLVGHDSGAVQTVKFVVDTHKPDVNVSFDENDARNDKYYNVTRTATIRVTDYTFSESSINLALNEKYGSAAKGSWTAVDGDKNIHELKITFDEDGIYSFDFDCTDMARNASDSSKGRVEEFIIDKTAPKIQVSYDNNEAKNGIYFNKERTATVQIDDLSFDEKLVRTELQAVNEAAELPSLGGFSEAEKEHIGHMNFTADGTYAYAINCEDLAGNSATTFTADVFVIDTTSPEVKFAGIENFSANNGTVAPSVSYVDKNMDIDASSITMTGSNNGVVNVGSQISPTADGFVVSYGDFEHVKSMDDLYTLKALVYDMAGNETEEQLVFSVNRFGSVFVLGDSAKLLNEQYYTNEPQDITITEINVDDLTYKNVSVSRDGDIRELKNNWDYSVSKQGSDETWKTYTYKISKDNFSKDGIYSVTVYTKDRATNVQDNKSKDAEINFAVDQTAPSIVTAGLKDGEVYKESSHNVNIDVTDNMGVTNLTVYKDGNVIETYDETALLADNGVESITLKESDQRQTISFVAEDVAGNIQTVVYSNILVSTKETGEKTIVDNNTPAGDTPGGTGTVKKDNTALFVILAIGVVAIGGGAGVGATVFKRKSSEE